MKKLLLAFLLSLCCVAIHSADGDTFTAKTIEGIDMKFKVISEADKTCQVGSSPLNSAISTSYTGSVTIPNSINGYSVIIIGMRAFSNCSGLTSVVIPSSVINIDYYAFNGCSSLTEVHITDLAAWCKIAFNNGPSNPLCYAHHLYLNSKEVKELVIPNNVTTIGNYTFYGGSEFTGSLTIPNSITSIGRYAFYGCNGFTGSLTIPNSVTSIGEAAFRYCSGFDGSLTIPNSVTYIGDYAFSGCKGFTGTLTLSNSLTSIGSNAFSDCSGFSGSLTIPSSVTSIGNSAFSRCSGFSGSLTIPNSATSIGSYAFYGCSGFTGSLTIPNSVTTIGEFAFNGCYGLTDTLTIPNSVISIKESAFQYCSKIKFVISEIQSPFEIRTDVFKGISSNATLQIPQGTKSKYQELPGWTTNFKKIIEEGEEVTMDGITYTVVSQTEKTVKVAAVNYSQVLTVPATVTQNGKIWTVTGIGNDALKDCKELAAVIWNPSAAFTATVSNPNLLLYVKAEEYAPAAIKNVVVNGTASSITLTEAASGNNFYCPQAFTARSISFTHRYSMTTGIGESRGWETLALPFDVQSITHETKGDITPFANRKSGDANKPFWLYELTGSGFVEAASIKAYTPYIISMPNNPQYDSQWLLSGSVTFAASNVTVGKTEDVNTATYRDRTFVPNFVAKGAADGLYALNVNNDYTTNESGMTEGSKFVLNIRTVHPFEAYMTTASNARQVIDVFEDMTTDIKMLGIWEQCGGDDGAVYDLQGRKVSHMTKGVYVGKKGQKYIK